MRTIALALLVTAACNGAAIRDYEVLELPRSSRQFAPGSKWTTAVGPSAPPPAGVEVSGFATLDKLAVEDRGRFVVDLKVPILDWIGGAAGLSAGEIVRLEFEDLRHVVVKDARPVVTVGSVLWEVLVAARIDVEITAEARARVDLGVDPVKARLADAVTGDDTIGITVDAGPNARSYVVTATRPLVVAIRVVRLDRRVTRKRTPLDLSSAAIGVGAQPAALGYTVVPTGGVDFLTKAATLRIRNPDFPAWAGDEFTFGARSDTWVNDRREVIASGDPAAAGADFVWDAMNIVWNRDLDRCSLDTVRQYVTLATVASGLSGTR